MRLAAGTARVPVRGAAHRAQLAGVSAHRRCGWLVGSLVGLAELCCALCTWACLVKKVPGAALQTRLDLGTGGHHEEADNDLP
ncbi:hypothetical protein NDU88_005974 [Pleurodeles waltl]|uniref:Uncharacterized protein n=1 Tax=Pleurodeles waltl TaxID=8319 RepID=A0AAV7RQM9_PLEWA|nr:hypothetical protein NDU88_005974 [Pleurodeles waltl]